MRVSASGNPSALATTVSTLPTSEGRYVTVHEPVPSGRTLIVQLGASSWPRALAGRVSCRCPLASGVPGWGRVSSMQRLMTIVEGVVPPGGHVVISALTLAVPPASLGRGGLTLDGVAERFRPWGHAAANVNVRALLVGPRWNHG